MYTLIYAICFYTLSLIITIPFLRFFKYGDARFISLLTISAISFTVGFILPFKTSFYIVFAVAIVVSLYTIHNHRDLKIDRSELIFTVVFAFFIFLRFLNPHIQDSEKFMDSAFMNAVLKSTSFPPNDPFFAGKKLDFYYYFGHVISACITLLSFSPPEVGYNIAISALPAYTALMIYNILKHKGRDEKVAIAGITLAIFSGNIFSFIDFFNRIFSGKPIDGSYYWNATRVISNTINEFPYFSFIHADLHAHVAAIPIVVLIVSLLSRVHEEKSKPVLIALSLSLFAVFATNSWNYPLTITLCILTAVSLKQKIPILAAILSIPFILILFTTMNTPAAKIEFVHERTSLIQFMMYALTPLLFSYIYTGNKYTIYALPLFIPSYLISPVLAVTAPLAISSVYGIYKKDFASALVLAGLTAFILPEFVAVESRMNTVFKFYLVAWLMLTIAPATKVEFKGLKRFALLFLLVVSLVYPLAATPVKYSTREYTLDGMVFMRHLDGDYEAIKWLQSKSGVTIEEGCTHGALCGYKYGGRVAAFTGNPDVIAWTNHEYVWRRNYSAVAERAMDVRSFYNAESCVEMMNIVKKYNISYIFYGYEERKIFSVKPEKFKKCFDTVFESRGTYVFVAKNLSQKTYNFRYG